MADSHWPTRQTACMRIPDRRVGAAKTARSKVPFYRSGLGDAGQTRIDRCLASKAACIKIRLLLRGSGAQQLRIAMGKAAKLRDDVAMLNRKLE